MPFTVNDCTVDTNSITIIFSDPVDKASATKAKHYKMFAPGSPDFSQPSIPPVAPSLLGDDSVQFSFSKKEFQPGDWVTIVVKGVKAADGTPLEDGIATIAGQVPGKG